MKFSNYLIEEVNWYDGITGVDKKISALIKLLSTDKTIKDHRDFHALADELGMDEAGDLEEKAYALLQSFFAQGRYMEKGSGKKFSEEELAMGDKVELEHTDNPVIARRIAMDHLTEISDYYTRLKKMEAAAGITD